MSSETERLDILIRAKADQYLREIDRADRKTKQFALDQEKRMLGLAKNGFMAASVAAVGLAVATGGIAIASVKMSAQYEQALTNALSVTGKFGKELDVARLEADKLAKQLGRDTAFSAREAAGAMYDLASKGYDVSTWAKTLPGILNLASATQSDLASTTELVTSTINQFNLAQEESGRVADVFAKAIGSSAATQEKLALSMAYVGPVASTLNWTLEDTVATLSRLYDAGFKAEQAGTAMRMVMLSIQDPAGDAEAVMARFGITAETLSRDKMPGLIKQLQDGNATAGDVAAMFGKEAAPAVLALLKAAEDPTKSIDKLDRSLENAAGTAEKVAKQQLDTLEGQFKLLKSSVEGAGIALGEIGSGALKDIVSDLIGPVNSVTEFLQGLDNISGWEGADLTGKIKIAWDDLNKQLSDWLDNPQGTGDSWTINLKVGPTGEDVLRQQFEGLGTSMGEAFMALIGADLEGAEDNPFVRAGKAAADAFVQGLKDQLDPVKIAKGSLKSSATLVDWWSDIIPGPSLSEQLGAIFPWMGASKGEADAEVARRMTELGGIGGEAYIREYMEKAGYLPDQIEDALRGVDPGPPGSKAGSEFGDGFIRGANAKLSNWNPPSLGGIADGWLRKGVAGGSGFGADLLAELQQLASTGAAAGGLTGHTAQIAGLFGGRFGISVGSGFRPGATIRNTGKPSLHSMGRGLDFFGSSAALWAAFNYAAANAGALGLQEILYQGKAWSAGMPFIHANRNAQSVRDHMDHLHIGTRYHTGGEVPAVLQVGERVLTAEQNSFLKDLSSSLRDLIDVIRANVNADKSIPAGGKGAAANAQILDLFGTRSGVNDSYIAREQARLGMLQALGYSINDQLAVVERQAEFLDKAVAEKAAQLQFAKDRGMSPEVINGIATELFDLTTQAAEARDTMEDLARVPLEQAAGRWAAGLSQVQTLMDLLGESSVGNALQSALFPDLMGSMGGGYQAALDLMNASTDPAAVMQYGGQAISALSGMFGAEKAQLDRGLADSLKSIDSAEAAWRAGWQKRVDDLDAELARESRVLDTHYREAREREQKRLTDLSRAQRDEVTALTRYYDEKLQALEDGEREITRAQERNRAQKALGSLENELRILQGQGYYTEADIARMRELETQIQEQRDQMAQQDAAWAREDARRELTQERNRALELLQQQQEAERIALEDQVRAAQEALDAQEQADRERLEARRQALADEERLQTESFERQRAAAQAQYQQMLDNAVTKYADLIRGVMEAESTLLGEATNFHNAGYTLGVSFADGLLAAIPSIAAAAQAAAAAAADYLQLNSPARLGPLSDLDTWWEKFMPTLLTPYHPPDAVRPIMDTAMPYAQALAGGGPQGATHHYFHLTSDGTGVTDAQLPELARLVSREIRREVDTLDFSYGV